MCNIKRERYGNFYRGVLPYLFLYNVSAYSTTISKKRMPVSRSSAILYSGIECRRTGIPECSV